MPMLVLFLPMHMFIPFLQMPMLVLFLPLHMFIPFLQMPMLVPFLPMHMFVLFLPMHMFVLFLPMHMFVLFLPMHMFVLFLPMHMFVLFLPMHMFVLSVCIGFSKAHDLTNEKTIAFHCPLNCSASYVLHINVVLQCTELHCSCTMNYITVMEYCNVVVPEIDRLPVFDDKTCV